MRTPIESRLPRTDADAHANDTSHGQWLRCKRCHRDFPAGQEAVFTRDGPKGRSSEHWPLEAGKRQMRVCGGCDQFITFQMLMGNGSARHRAYAASRPLPNEPTLDHV